MKVGGNDFWSSEVIASVNHWRGTRWRTLDGKKEAKKGGKQCAVIDAEAAAQARSARPS